MGPLMNAEGADLQNRIHESPLGSAEVVPSCDNVVTTSFETSKLPDDFAASAARFIAV